MEIFAWIFQAADIWCSQFRSGHCENQKSGRWEVVQTKAWLECTPAEVGCDVCAVCKCPNRHEDEQHWDQEHGTPADNWQDFQWVFNFVFENDEQ